MGLDIAINLGDTIKKLRSEAERMGLGSPAFERAVSRAMNRTATAAKTQSAREIRKTYRIGTRVISKSMSLRKSNPETLQASVWASGKPLPAIAFDARKTKQGVTINVKGSRKLLRGAFLLKLGSGHVGVFARADLARGYEGGEFLWRHVRLQRKGPDLPIAELRSVGVPRAFGNKLVIKALEAKSRTEFPRVLAREVAYRSTLG